MQERGRISFNDSESEKFAEERVDDFMIEEDVHRQIRNEVERLPEAMRKVFNLTLLDSVYTRDCRDSGYFGKYGA